MNKFLKYLFLISIISGAICLSSCQKEFTVENLEPPQDSTFVLMDSNVISKVIYYDSVAGGADVFLERTFIYDSLKRLSEIIEVEPNYNKIVTKFYYSGNDSNSIGYLLTDSLDISFGIAAERHFFTRDSQKRLVKDSVTSNPGFFNVATYNYNSNLIKLQRYTPPSPGNISLWYGDATLDLNGNITKIITSEPSMSLGDSSAFFFDNKFNPYYRLRNTTEIFNEYLVYDYESILFNRNNIIRFYDTESGSPVLNNIIYTYNAAGYPIAAYESNDDIYIKYIYKSL